MKLDHCSGNVREFDLRSCVLVGKGHSDEFEVKVSVHQGPVLSPQLFIILLDALSREMGSF